MSNSRREFLQSSTALAMGMMAGGATALAERGPAQLAGSQAAPARTAAPSANESRVRVPR